MIGLLSVLMGLQTLSFGQSNYDQSLHELRRTYWPDTLATQPVIKGGNLTWEEVNRYVIQAEAWTLIVSGLLILVNRKCTGGLLLFLGVAFIVMIKDYPWLRHNALKTASKERNEKISDFLKNLSMLGASILLMLYRGDSTKCPFTGGKQTQAVLQTGNKQKKGGNSGQKKKN
jgi:hypothetical protein